jgi:glycosyltransferase involved in cell wall biosynthesis
MPIRLIYNHIQHHARFSGYDQLAKYVDAEPFEGKGLAHRWAEKISWKRLAKFSYYDSAWYGGPALRRELEICARMLLPSSTLYHFFYAENDLRVTSLWKLRLNNRIVGSFHQPPEFLEHHVEDKRYIEGVSAAVVMSQSQVPFLEQFLPRKRIFHVPHGVDTDYWCPHAKSARWRAPTFLVVGQWLRDIELVSATIRAINRVDQRIRFKIVTFPEYAEQFRGLEGTKVMTGIPDEQLREEYRRARALFLPLKLSTSNNAVLEAMACGTGVISTHTGGVPEYLDSTCSALIEPGDVDTAVAHIRAIAKDDDRTARMGKAARARAVELYSWPKVGRRMMEAYEAIMDL